MHNLTENTKTILLACETKAAGDPTAKAAQVDFSGWSRATFLLAVGSTDATVDMKIQESDTTTAGDFADVADAALTQIPATGDDKLYAVELNLDGRMRYGRPVITAGAGATGAALSCVCILSRGSASPIDAAGAGLTQRILI